jgi:hypothetical protein
MRRGASAICLVTCLSACGGQVVFVGEGSQDGAGGATSSTSLGGQEPTLGGATSAFFCFVGPYDEACAQCQAFACAGLQDQCKDACGEYSSCVFSCGNELACCEACASQNLEGAEQYTALVKCVACERCSVECAEAVPGFCAE